MMQFFKVFFWYDKEDLIYFVYVMLNEKSNFSKSAWSAISVMSDRGVTHTNL